MNVGFPWISLDFLVRIVTYQWVTRIFREKKFSRPFPHSAAGTGPGSLNIQTAQDCSSRQFSIVSDFPQLIVVRSVSFRPSKSKIKAFNGVSVVALVKNSSQ
jgi:hypothetical protein